MITIEQAAKVLEYFDFGCAIMDDGSVFITLHPATNDPLFTQGGSAYEPEDAKDMALRILSQSEEVMGRVWRWLNAQDDGCYKWERLDGSRGMRWRLVDQSNASFNSEPVNAEWLLKRALSLDMTPEQMMGAEG